MNHPVRSLRLCCDLEDTYFMVFDHELCRSLLVNFLCNMPYKPTVSGSHDGPGKFRDCSADRIAEHYYAW